MSNELHDRLFTVNDMNRKFNWLAIGIFIIILIQISDGIIESDGIRFYIKDFWNNLLHMVMEILKHIGTACLVVGFIELFHNEGVEKRYFGLFGQKIYPLYHSLEVNGVIAILEKLDENFFSDNIQNCSEFTSIMTYIPGIELWADLIRRKFEPDYKNCKIYLLDPNNIQAELRTEILGNNYKVKDSITHTQDILRSKGISYS